MQKLLSKAVVHNKQVETEAAGSLTGFICRLTLSREWKNF